MASDVEIVNNALLMLGDQFITSLDDDTNRARLANSLYGPTRDSILRAHPWNCAVTRSSLAKLADAPAFGWVNAFQLPTNPYCLRVLDLNANQLRGVAGEQFRVEGRKLLTNAGTAHVRYICRITDPNQYDSLLYEAFSVLLASKMAYGITASNNNVEELVKLYQSLLQQARTINGQEGSPAHEYFGGLTDFR